MQPHQHAQETLKTLVISSESPTWTAFRIGKFYNLYLTKVNKDIADLLDLLRSTLQRLKQALNIYIHIHTYIQNLVDKAGKSTAQILIINNNKVRINPIIIGTVLVCILVYWCVNQCIGVYIVSKCEEFHLPMKE